MALRAAHQRSWDARHSDAGAKRSYAIPRGVPAERAAGTATRGIVSALGNKFLKEMVFPLIDPIIGEVSAPSSTGMEQPALAPTGSAPSAPAISRRDVAPELDADG